MWKRLSKISGTCFPVLYPTHCFSVIRKSSLESELQSLRRQGMTSTSQRIRSFQWNKFWTLRETNGFQCLPASTHTVALYVAFLSRTLQCTTVSNYLSGIASLHHHNNYESPDFNHYEIKQTLAGIQRNRYRVTAKARSDFTEARICRTREFPCNRFAL